MAAVELCNITKKWGQVVAVNDISLRVPDGEFCVFLGPSGCGKTTTMRMVAGLEAPSAGTVRISDIDVTHLEPKDRDVAMVFQSYSLYPQMSVYENIRFPLRARRAPRRQHSERVRKAAAMVELTEYLERKPGELSGGQRQRVALARAIVRSPQVFLMDEPLSNLDARLRVSMRAQIKHLHEELGVTIIYVTHDQVEAMTLADRVVLMNAGRIEQIGPPREIYDDPQSTFVAGFVGSPSMNLISGGVEGNRFTADVMTTSVSCTGTNSEVTLGVRPEDLSMVEPSNAEINGIAFAVEPIGDATLVTVKADEMFLVAKLAKDCRVRSGDTVGLSTTGPKFLFDKKTGMRLHGNSSMAV